MFHLFKSLILTSWGKSSRLRGSGLFYFTNSFGMESRDTNITFWNQSRGFVIRVDLLVYFKIHNRLFNLVPLSLFTGVEGRRRFLWGMKNKVIKVVPLKEGRHDGRECTTEHPLLAPMSITIKIQCKPLRC